MSDTRAQAVVLLVNYFEAIARKAGIQWDADYTAEIAAAVDHIIDTAVWLTPTQAQRYREIDERLVEVVRRLDKHERQLRAGGL